MNIKWYGQSCFLITINNFKIVTDPFGNVVNYTLPTVKPELITVSHYHDDHADSEFLKKAPVLDFNTPFFKKNKIEINGFKSFHDKCKGKERGKNFIFKFNIDTLSIIHLGDLGHNLPKTMENTSCDILLAPFGGFYTIDGYKSYEIAQKLNSKILIPMHYKTEWIDFDLKKLQDYNLSFEKLPELNISDKSLLPDKLTLIKLNVSI
ncbi:MAG: MBL fold metallo-hydrolase [Candidatus Muiribacteriota bacterium]